MNEKLERVRVLIVVEGGVVQNVMLSGNAQVFMVDWDVPDFSEYPTENVTSEKFDEETGVIQETIEASTEEDDDG